MRKVLFLFVVIFTTNAYAQSWEVETIEADALKGTPVETKYTYRDSTQAFSCMGTGTYWKVGVRGRIYQPDKRGLVVYGTYNPVTYALIGLYDERGQLVAKYENCALQLVQGMQVAETVDSKKKIFTKGVRDVSAYIREKTGYVRIVIPTVRGEEFDLKVPCLNNK